MNIKLPKLKPQKEYETLLKDMEKAMMMSMALPKDLFMPDPPSSSAWLPRSNIK